MQSNPNTIYSDFVLFDEQPPVNQTSPLINDNVNLGHFQLGSGDWTRPTAPSSFARPLNVKQTAVDPTQQLPPNLLAKLPPSDFLSDTLVDHHFALSVDPSPNVFDVQAINGTDSVSSTPYLDSFDTPFTAASSLDFECRTPFTQDQHSIDAALFDASPLLDFDTSATSTTPSTTPFSAPEASFGQVHNTPVFQAIDFDTDYPESSTGLSRESSGASLDQTNASAFFAPLEEVLLSSQGSLLLSSQETAFFDSQDSAQSSGSEYVPESESVKVKTPAPVSKKTIAKNSSKRVAFTANGEPIRRFQCPCCDRPPFARKYNLDQHIKTHDSGRDRAFGCQFCNRQFSRKHDLQRHAESVHKGQQRRKKE